VGSPGVIAAVAAVVSAFVFYFGAMSLVVEISRRPLQSCPHAQGARNGRIVFGAAAILFAFVLPALVADRGEFGASLVAGLATLLAVVGMAKALQRAFRRRGRE